jgi:hypothetical protein
VAAMASLVCWRVARSAAAFSANFVCTAGLTSQEETGVRALDVLPAQANPRRREMPLRRPSPCGIPAGGVTHKRG